MTAPSLLDIRSTFVEPGKFKGNSRGLVSAALQMMSINAALAKFSPSGTYDICRTFFMRNWTLIVLAIEVIYMFLSVFCALLQTERKARRQRSKVKPVQPKKEKSRTVKFNDITHVTFTTINPPFCTM